MKKKPVVIQFDHMNAAILRRFTAQIEPGNPATTCTIFVDYEPFYKDPSRSSIRFFGLGVCKHGDTYDPETGCRMSLKSALRGIDEKEVRAAFWKSYLKIFPVEKRVKPEPPRALSFFDLLQKIGVPVTFSA